VISCLALLAAALAPSASPTAKLTSGENVHSAYIGRSSGFAAARSYPAGSGPVAVALGDLNGDGKPDLVTANLYANSLSVLLNRGDGSFQTKTDHRAGGDPHAVAIGNLNGDSEPDLVAVNADANTVSVLLNGGDARFEPRRDSRVEAGPVAVAIGDLNRDGRPDVATANRTASVSVLLNRGDGSLLRARNFRTGMEPVSVAVGDVNSDGEQDLVSADLEANTVSVLTNRGDGTFQPRRSYTTGLHPTAVAIGDLNGDGRPELATSNLDANTVSVFPNENGGRFGSRKDYPTGGDPRSVSIRDLDGDGRPEIVTPEADASVVSVLLNTGGGSLARGGDYATGRRPVSVATGDLDGDGNSDVVTADLEGGTVSALLGSTSVLCTVPNLMGMTVGAATEAAGEAHCRAGSKISRAFSDSVQRGAVIATRPRRGATLPEDGEVELVVSRGRSAAFPGGLLLWNKLGGKHGVTHSAYGPDLALFDCRDATTPHFGRRCAYDVPGTLAYPHGVFGGAAAVAGGPYFSSARVHTALLRASILNPEHGAVEVWFRQASDPVPTKHNPHRIFGGPYSLTGADEVMLFSQDNSGSGGPRLHFEVFFGEEPPPYRLAHVVPVRSLQDGVRGAPISASNGRWIHVAGVWDRKGIAGTTDTVRLYANGRIVAAAKARNWGTTLCGRRVSARPGGACFTDIVGCNDRCAGTFAVDDLKLWGYARTHYSARPAGRP
jgi:hypothetical protein